MVFGFQRQVSGVVDHSLRQSLDSFPAARSAMPDGPCVFADDDDNEVDDDDIVDDTDDDVAVAGDEDTGDDDDDIVGWLMAETPHRNGFCACVPGNMHYVENMQPLAILWVLPRK